MFFVTPLLNDIDNNVISSTGLSEAGSEIIPNITKPNAISTQPGESEKERVKRNRIMMNKFFNRGNVETSLKNENNDDDVTENDTNVLTTTEEINNVIESTTMQAVEITTLPSTTIASISPIIPPINNLPLQDEPFPPDTGLSHQNPMHDITETMDSNHQHIFQNPPHQLAPFNHPSYPNSNRPAYAGYNPNRIDNYNNQQFYPPPNKVQHYPSYGVPPTIPIASGQYGYSQTKNVDKISLTTNYPFLDNVNSNLVVPNYLQDAPQKFKPSPVDIGNSFRPSNYDVSLINNNIL